MVKGTVKFFNKNKVYGFIHSEEDDKDYFVHITDVKEGTELNDGDGVTFEIVQGDRGLKAVNVEK